MLKMLRVVRFRLEVIIYRQIRDVTRTWQSRHVPYKVNCRRVIALVSTRAKSCDTIQRPQTPIGLTPTWPAVWPRAVLPMTSPWIPTDDLLTSVCRWKAEFCLLLDGNSLPHLNAVRPLIDSCVLLELQYISQIRQESIKPDSAFIFYSVCCINISPKPRASLPLNRLDCNVIIIIE